MNTNSGQYDPELQMFIDPPREPDLAHLRFLRWLNGHEPLEARAGGARIGENTIEAAPKHPVAA